MIEVIREPESDLLASATAKLNEIMETHSDVPTLVLLSGGSALKIPNGLDPTLFKNSTIGVLDERFSYNPAENNFMQLQSTSFYTAAEANGAKFISTVPLDGEDKEALAARFENGLRQWKAENPTGVVIITQGIGDDAHTAGIMPFIDDATPFTALFENPTKWVVAYDASGKNPYPLRVTITFAFLRDIVDFSIVYIAGEKKRPALEKALDAAGTLNEAPSRVINTMKGHVYVYTDIEES